MAANALHLILNLIQGKEAQFDHGCKQIALVRTAWDSIRRRDGFASDFSLKSRRPANFRYASQCRYGGEDKRYAELPFSVFCFLGPHLTENKVSSIDDVYWPYLVVCVSAHVEKFSIPDNFLEGATRRLNNLQGGVADSFRAEYHRTETNRQAAEFKSRLQFGTPIEETVEEIVQISTEWKETLKVVATEASGSSLGS